MERRDYAAAVALFTEAIKFVPTLVAYANRAAAYTELSEFDKAIADYDQAIQLNNHALYSDMPGIRYNRGRLFYKQKEYAKAIDDFDFCIGRQAHFSPAFFGRALCYLRLGKLKEARWNVERALKLRPTDVQAHLVLAEFCGREGDAKGSQTQIENILALLEKSKEPASGYNSVAWFLATAPDDRIRNGKQAEVYASKACELSGWRDPMLIDTLAAACAAAGNFQDAIKWEEKFLAAGDLNTEQRLAAEKRLVLYRDSKPYFDKE